MGVWIGYWTDTDCVVKYWYVAALAWLFDLTVTE